ncbi:restriction endonuclease [Flavobacterium capsici]|uniref:Restriction endonuclease n=1 Tax=Flavobacterium capsici TaxID=3075618 RepID=A0AA96F0F3_9FLAO|nr:MULTISPECIES: restriction endonuclease [unclassified Flavobacterium]WNM20098.1 restriction endonuclease [Flavobacterium sp. PMR2A8]WNM21487.1 restriction endonuclease [Flavobacterium sp. PMTSA4]
MNNEWLEFEKLTARVYTIINNGNGIVKHNDKIKGINSKRDRQIDVSIKYLLPGNHSILIIVSCKNYKKKPNIRLIDEFVGLLQDVNANKGILICKSGFGNSILEYAKTKQIDLCTIEDLENRNLLDDIRIPISFYKFDYNFSVNFSLENIKDKNNFPKISFKSKSFTFDKKIFFSLNDYILEFWKLKKLDSISEPFKEIENITRIFYQDNHDFYLLFNFNLMYEKKVDIKYLLFEPTEYYKIKHYTEKNESSVYGFNNELFDFEKPFWLKEKPVDFESNLFYGNFLFLSINDTLDAEILNEFDITYK